MENVFIYSLNCPITNTPRYIGKSHNLKERLCNHLKDPYKSHKSNWIKSLKINGLKPTIEIIDSVSESDWSFWEQHYISLYKSWGFKLTNGDNGGLGTGRHTQETRLKIGASNKGIPKTKGRKHSDETKNKIGASNIGKHSFPHKKNRKQITIKGEKNPNSKLNLIQVNEIKLKRGTFSVSQLAKEYAISKSMIYHITNGRNWK